MEKKSIIIKALAVVGTVLVWIPILVTLITAIIGTISARTLRFDFLIPAELFPAALVGALLLLWTAMRSHSYQKPIGLGLGAMVVFLLGGQGIAMISGLASGKIELGGAAWVVVMITIVLYSLALLEVCIAGILLLIKLYSE